MSSTDNAYTIVHQDDAGEQIGTQDFKKALEKGSEEVKIDTMKRILTTMLNGDPQPGLLMHVIRFVMPSKNKTLKKLLHFYWEICPKYNEDGKLKQEMILVCNAIRNDLQHPNEYIRGATLRFLCKLREPELLEPLIPTCRQNLEHRHAYVRKNAVFAVYTIFRHFEYLIPDAPELIHTFLVAEADVTCKRNAFVMLLNCAQAKAVEYLLEAFDQIPTFDELLQLAIIELIRKDSHTNPSMKGRYIRAIFDLLEVPSHAVKYEAATTLTSLTHNPAAIKAAAQCYIDLIIKESDNNVKLIVLDRLNRLREKHERVLDDLCMEILRVLSSPDMEVRRKALHIALEMISSKNVEDVVSFLKKELAKTLEQDHEKNAEYRQLLIQSIHTCAIRFSEVAASVVHVLMEFLNDSNNLSAVDVIAFVREVVEKLPNLRKDIISKLLSSLTEVRSGKVFRGALWIIGEYCQDAEDIAKAFSQIRSSLGEVPIVASEQRLLEEKNEELKIDDEVIKQTSAASRRILPDGTYATETAFSTNAASLEAVKAAAKPPLRSLILSGDYFLGSVLASSLTKLVMHYADIATDLRKVNALKAEAMLMMTSIARVGQSPFSAIPIDEDSYERIMNCLQSLEVYTSEKEIKEVFTQDTKAAFAKILAAKEKKAAEEKAKDTSASVQVDDVLVFRQFAKRSGGDEFDEYESDLTKATGSADSKTDLQSKLSRVVQLTGFSDPVYAEAYVNVHQFDIMLDVLIVNQTMDTLQNLSIEFATLGDLKLVERPSMHNLSPHSFHSIKATIKVSSTETGVIFGNIVYDGPGTSESNCVVLNDIHVDIMDYINPATCNETQFRSMWTEFEWENKVNVTTPIADLRQYLEHIQKSTNMSCLTPEAALSGDCGFLSANLYARSLFGEDALANLSIEKQDKGPITGHVRIRAKTQGIALSLGDKITNSQKAVAAA